MHKWNPKSTVGSSNRMTVSSNRKKLTTFHQTADLSCRQYEKGHKLCHPCSKAKHPIAMWRGEVIMKPSCMTPATTTPDPTTPHVLPTPQRHSATQNHRCTKPPQQQTIWKFVTSTTPPPEILHFPEQSQTTDQYATVQPQCNPALWTCHTGCNTNRDPWPMLCLPSSPYAW